jgi:hypothetical protein
MAAEHRPDIPLNPNVRIGRPARSRYPFRATATASETRRRNLGETYDRSEAVPVVGSVRGKVGSGHFAALGSGTVLSSNNSSSLKPLCSAHLGLVSCGRWVDQWVGGVVLTQLPGTELPRLPAVTPTPVRTIEDFSVSFWLPSSSPAVTCRNTTSFTELRSLRRYG